MNLSSSIALFFSATALPRGAFGLECCQRTWRVGSDRCKSEQCCRGWEDADCEAFAYWRGDGGEYITYCKDDDFTETGYDPNADINVCRHCCGEWLFTPAPTPRPTPPMIPPTACMSGDTRVGVKSNAQLKPARDLDVGDIIEGLDENMDRVTCSVEAIGSFGIGGVVGNYTKGHFILDESREFVRRHRPIGENGEEIGISGEEEIYIDRYAILASCPVGLDESGVGFTAVDSDYLGNEDVAWSDYVKIHESILNIVKECGDFVFWPSTYISMGKVKKYIRRLCKTMLKCANDADMCDDFEKAAVNLVDNALTKKAKKKVKSAFGNLGISKMAGSVSAAVSKGKSVRE